MVLGRILGSKSGQELTKQVLKEVDDLVIKKKTVKDPSKLLKKKEDVIIDDENIAVGQGGEKTKIGVKDFKAKQPQVSKETIDEFLQSFNTNTIPKKILADFNIDKITKNEDIFQMINGIAKGYKPSEIVKQTRGVKKQSATKAAGIKLFSSSSTSNSAFLACAAVSFVFSSAISPVPVFLL